MPSRIVREGINSSPRVNALSFGAELLYRRLMSVADDYGRFHGSPITILGACWPTCPERVSPDQVSGWLNECCEGPKPLIQRYEVNGSKYIEICGFGQQRRSPSKFPEPSQSDPEPTGNHPAKQMLSNCDQNVGTSRSRISKSYSESMAGATIARQPVLGSEWPETTAAIRGYFPATDDPFIWSVIQDAGRDYCDVANGSGIPALSDAILAEAVHTSHFKKQTSAGPFKKLVPRCIRSWAEEAVRQKRQQEIHLLNSA